MIGEILLSESEIQCRVKELGQQITKDYENEDSLICLGILKGSAMFMMDLIRHIDHPNLTTDYMRVSSYGSHTESAGVVRLIMDINDSIEEKNLLIIEDIVDTCLTMKFLIDALKIRNPKSIRVCSLLRKDNARVNVPIDYIGFEIDKKAFVIGYGIDYDEKYRNLKYLARLELDDTHSPCSV